MNGFSRSASVAARPIIGITPEELDARGNIILPRAYADAVARAGGLPLILPIWQGAAAALLAQCDGIVLSGGSDVDPAHYGGDAHPAVYGVDRVRDDEEIALVRLAHARGIPTLAICRGLQVLNVALGGTLHPHLPDLPGGDIAHRAEPYGGVTHAIEVVPETRLAAILGAQGEPPISWHHQAIDRVAPELRVVARASDGCIEAVECAEHPWLLGVQWHPELSAAADPAQQRLFDALIAACKQVHEARDGVESTRHV